jgi:hypothetical protein
MAISGPASFLPTTDEFLGHWETADTELGAGNAIVLADGTNRAGLLAKRNELEGLRATVQSTLIDQELNREDIEGKKTALLLRVNQFNDAVRSDFAGTKWERVLKDVPKQNDGQSTFVDPLVASNHIWSRLNAAIAPAAPLKLLGNYTQGQFQDDIDALNAAYPVWTESVNDTRFAREDRNDMQDVIYAILLAYRRKVPTKFAAGHAAIDSLPRLTPEPGATPSGVTINAAWSEPAQAAEVNFPASPDANVVQYEVRIVPGPTYNSDDEVVVGNIPAGPGPFTFQTAAALSNPGNVVSIKVYVINDTGNEKGSNAVAVTRPLEPTPPTPP